MNKMGTSKVYLQVHLFDRISLLPLSAVSHTRDKAMRKCLTHLRRLGKSNVQIKWRFSGLRG